MITALVSLLIVALIVIFLIVFYAILFALVILSAANPFIRGAVIIFAVFFILLTIASVIALIVLRKKGKFSKEFGAKLKETKFGIAKYIAMIVLHVALYLVAIYSAVSSALLIWFYIADPIVMLTQST